MSLNHYKSKGNKHFRWRNHFSWWKIVLYKHFPCPFESILLQQVEGIGSTNTRILYFQKTRFLSNSNPNQSRGGRLCPTTVLLTEEETMKGRNKNKHFRITATFDPSMVIMTLFFMGLWLVFKFGKWSFIVPNNHYSLYPNPNEKQVHVFCILNHHSLASFLIWKSNRCLETNTFSELRIQREKHFPLLPQVLSSNKCCV